MTKLKINFAEKDNSKLPDGTYEAIIDKAEIKNANDGNSQYINWQFSVTDEDFFNRKEFGMTSLKSTAGYFLRRTFETLGVTFEKLEDGTYDVELDVEAGPTADAPARLVDPDFEGMKVTIEVKTDPSKRDQRGNLVRTVTITDSEANVANEKIDDSVKEPATPPTETTGTRRKL